MVMPPGLAFKFGVRVTFSHCRCGGSPTKQLSDDNDDQ